MRSSQTPPSVGPRLPPRLRRGDLVVIERVGHAAESRPTGRTARGAGGCGSGCVERAADLQDPVAGGVHRRHQLRHRLHRQVRDPGQLQRLPGVGHLQSEQAGPHQGLSSARPRRATSRCYRNLLFVSGEDLSARLDCGTQGVEDTVSTDRLRGLRIFDISDIRNPKNVGNVQTCRGLAHPLGAGGSQGHGERLRLHLGLLASCGRPTSWRLRRGDAGAGSQHGLVPHRGDQGAAGPSRAGRDRQLAADLRQPEGAADAR